MQIETGDTPARASSLLVIQGNQHGGPVKTLDQPRGDDTDHARMPAGGRQDNGLFVVQIHLAPDLAKRLSQHLRLDPLALLVFLLEQLGEGQAFVRAVGQEQLHPGAGIAQSVPWH